MSDIDKHKKKKSKKDKKKSKKKHSDAEETDTKVTAEVATPPVESALAVDDSNPPKKKKKSKKDKKRKADEISSVNEDDTNVQVTADVKTSDAAPTAVDKATGQVTKKAKKRTPVRYTVFVGNMNYETTKEQIEAHFEQAVVRDMEKLAAKEKTKKGQKDITPAANKKGKSGAILSVRLLTHKDSGISKGTAFVEFDSAQNLNRGLALHHSFLGARKINVELTASGGRNGEARRKKIAEKNRHLAKQRARKMERSKLRASMSKTPAYN